MAIVLALDQGTTSSRAILFDDAGATLSVAQREFRQIYPEPGHVEHDAVEICESQLAVAREALTQAGLEASEVAAIGITNQRETVVVWDRATGVPIHNAIVWQDRRTADRCAELRDGPVAERIRERTGLQIDPYFSASKLAWLLENVEGARTRADAGDLAFGTIDCWLLWNLTGGRVHATDASNASRTMLFDIHTGAWDDELLQIFDIPTSVLPEVRGSCERFGDTDADLLGVPVAVAGIAGDQQAALFGQMCVEPGMAKNTYGTGCFLLLNTGSEAVVSNNRLLTTVAWRIDGETTYALEGSVFIGGAAVQWLRDGLGIIESASDVETLARSVADSGGVVCVPAFAGLGAPYWDAYARGAIVGITRGTTASHLARATLEGIAHQVTDVLEAMRADSGAPLDELRVDGGAAANDLLLEIQTEMLGADVVRPGHLETTALGAAYLAGLAVGVWEGTEELARRWAVDRRFVAPEDRGGIAEQRAAWRRAVERARGWERPA